MTEERKQELTQLLEEAMDGLQIGVRLGGSCTATGNLDHSLI